jgi:hypothetical protein
MRESLRSPLEKAAKSQAVSLNAEIVRRLERSFEWETLEDLFQTVFRPALEGMDKIFAENLELQKKWEASNRLYEERLKDLAAAKGEVPTHAEAAARKKAELVVEARHLSGNPNLQPDEALTYLAKRGNAQAKAILTETREKKSFAERLRAPLKRA